MRVIEKFWVCSDCKDAHKKDLLEKKYVFLIMRLEIPEQAFKSIRLLISKQEGSVLVNGFKPVLEAKKLG